MNETTATQTPHKIDPQILGSLVVDAPMSVDVSIDTSSPPVDSADILRFRQLGGMCMLSLNEKHQEVPSASIENGIDGEIHIEWSTEALEVFLSVWPGCQKATLSALRLAEKESQSWHFSIDSHETIADISRSVVDIFSGE